MSFGPETLCKTAVDTAKGSCKTALDSAKRSCLNIRPSHPSQEVKVISKLKAGDVIYLERRAYKHFAVVVHTIPEKDCFVCVELTVDEEGSGIISTCGYTKEDADGVLYVLELYEKCFPPEEVVKRAFSKLGPSDYHVLTYNCEHFAFWCKTGKATSLQTVIAGVPLDEVAKVIFEAKKHA